VELETVPIGNPLGIIYEAVVANEAVLTPVAVVIEFNVLPIY